VRDYKQLQDNYKTLHSENYQLRDYIINLQSRLIESQGELPAPPANIDLNNPRDDPTMAQIQSQLSAPTPPTLASTASDLQASAAQAVSGLGLGGREALQNGKHHEESAYLSEEYPSKRYKSAESTEFTAVSSEAAPKFEAVSSAPLGV
jgi:hypothetical protein